jgi:hypothetical protein
MHEASKPAGFTLPCRGRVGARHARRGGVRGAAKRFTPSRPPSLTLRRSTSPLQREVKKEGRDV